MVDYKEAANPCDALKYKNWENGGLSKEDIKKRLDGSKYNPTLQELYDNAINLLDDMEIWIVNTNNMPYRAALDESFNNIHKLKNSLKAKKDIIPESILELKSKVSNEELEDMADLIDGEENKYLKYLRGIASGIMMSVILENPVEKNIDDYGKFTCLSNGSFNPKDLFRERTFQQGDYYYMNDKKEKIYMNFEHPVHVNTKNKEFIIDYTNTDTTTKKNFLKAFGYSSPNDVFLRGTISMDNNGNIDYKVGDVMYSFPPNRLLPLGKGVTIQEKKGYEISEEDRKNTEKRQREREEKDREKEEIIESVGGLSKEDFERDFKGDDFEQEELGNCWQLGFLDSFTNFGDYEFLIRTNVEKNNQGGYNIYLPMRYPPNNKEGKMYSITSIELESKQLDDKKKEIKVVTGSIGIKCLVWAMTMHITGTDGIPNFSTLQAGIGLFAADNLLDNETFGKISFMDKNAKNLENFLSSLDISKEDMEKIYKDFINKDLTLETVWEMIKPLVKKGLKEPYEIPGVMYDIYKLYRQIHDGKETGFRNVFSQYLARFNKKTDMMTVTVLWDDKRENVTNRSAFKGTPHDLSVDNVYAKDSEYYVQLSNPRNAGAKRHGDPNYIPPIPLRDLISKCLEFTFVSKDKEKVRSYTDSPCRTSSDTKKILMKVNVGAKRGDNTSADNAKLFNGRSTLGKDIFENPPKWMTKMKGAENPNFTVNLIKADPSYGFSEGNFKKDENIYLVSSYNEKTYVRTVLDSNEPMYEFIIGNNTFKLKQSTFGDKPYDIEYHLFKFINFVNYVSKMVKQNKREMNFELEGWTLVINGTYKIDELIQNLGLRDGAEISSILHMLNVIGSKYFQ